MSGLEGLAGTPQRVVSPSVVSPPSTNNNMDDLMGVFGNVGDNGMGVSSTGAWGGSQMDMMNGFAALDLSGGTQMPSQQPAPGQAKKNTNEDILGLF
jgi:AP-1 complex subunit beta-1